MPRTQPILKVACQRVIFYQSILLSILVNSYAEDALDQLMGKIVLALHGRC